MEVDIADAIDAVAAHWIAADWGTTHLRVYALSAKHEVLAKAESADGMSQLEQGQFEAALLKLVDGWLPAGKTTTVLACGMVGARQGWMEAPYQPAPCPPLNSQQLLAVDTEDQRLQVFILPGISQSQPADVMRGEETQLAGLLAQTSNSAEAITVCLPGTHSKWARLHSGSLEHFATFMTGEVFALFGQHSILRHSVDSTGWDNAAFHAGVSQGLAQPEQLLSDCFRLRAEGLLADLSPAITRSRLSGLLLGSELAGAKTYWQGQTVHLIGDDKLAGLYARALRIAGADSIQHAPDTMTLAGLRQAYQHL